MIFDYFITIFIYFFLKDMIELQTTNFEQVNIVEI